MAFGARVAPTGSLASCPQDSGTQGSGSKAAGAAGSRSYATQTPPTARKKQCGAEWAAAMRRPGGTPPTPSRAGDSNGRCHTALPCHPPITAPERNIQEVFR